MKQSDLDEASEAKIINSRAIRFLINIRIITERNECLALTNSLKTV